MKLPTPPGGWRKALIRRISMRPMLDQPKPWTWNAPMLDGGTAWGAAETYEDAIRQVYAYRAALQRGWRP